MDYDKQIDTIFEAAKKVQLNQVTVLTGMNGSGKSLVRKLLSSFLSKRNDAEIKVCSVSMESRSQLKHDFAALKAVGIDDPEAPTGCETVKNIRRIVNYASDQSTPRFIVIDEPEIGMGEELVASLVNELHKLFHPLPSNCIGVMLITHNRYIVRNLKSKFVNMEGMLRSEWLERKIVPTDIAKFEDDSLGLWRRINNRMEENRIKEAKAKMESDRKKENEQRNSSTGQENFKIDYIDETAQG